MAIEWINVKTRVPDDRRPVIAWGTTGLWGVKSPYFQGGFLGETRFNPSPSGGKFDLDHVSLRGVKVVTHWAEITPPADAARRGPGQPDPER